MTALGGETQVALTLRLLGGLTTADKDEITIPETILHKIGEKLGITG